MSSSRSSFSWSSEGTAGRSRQVTDPGETPAALLPSLHERLADVCTDRAATAEEVVLETSRIALDWVLERSGEWTWERAGIELEGELATWSTAQGWRGPCAVWLDAVRRTWQWGAGYEDFSHPRPAVGPVELLAEELGLWAFGHELEDADGKRSAPWNGEPLADGRRMPARRDVALHAAREIERNELVLVSGYSETVACALEAAQREGKQPEVWIAEALPNLEGRRLARRLALAGLTVHLGYDSGLLDALPRADRVWLPTEAIGAHSFLARIGTRALIEEAERREVPVAVLATSDKLIPGGELLLPEWCAREAWLLWDEAPAGVHLETQAFEAVPIDLVGRFWTEVGAESATALHLRALRVEAAAPCARLVRDGAERSDLDGREVRGFDEIPSARVAAPTVRPGPVVDRATDAAARSEVRATGNTFDDGRS